MAIWRSNESLAFEDSMLCSLRGLCLSDLSVYVDILRVQILRKEVMVGFEIQPELAVLSRKAESNIKFR